MNIDNHFYSAEVYLEMAKEKVSAQDYDSALSSLGKAYSNIRDLLLQVYQLKRNTALAARPAGESKGGP